MIEREASNGERLSLGYDGANRLVRLTRTSAQGATEEARYRYDALGRRISKTVHHANGTTATTHYGWDGDRLACSLIPKLAIGCGLSLSQQVSMLQVLIIPMGILSLLQVQSLPQKRQIWFLDGSFLFVLR
jgi:YD repeat-containing protein